MANTTTYLGLIPLLPLVGAAVIGFLHLGTCKGERLPERFYGLLACTAPIATFLLAV